MNTKPRVMSNASQESMSSTERLNQLRKDSPIADHEYLQNMALYMPRQTLSRMFFMHEMYSKIVDVHGVVMEFGVRWGQNLSLFQSFRGMYEPYNYNRKIIGFDTFSGFPSVHKKDGEKLKEGDYSVTEGYDDHLNEVLEVQESLSPLPHIKKFELCKGDAPKELKNYLERQPETLISLAYFDFDIYKPTKDCLELILPRMPKGSIIGFDELNCPQFPGETSALIEVLDITKYKLHRSPLNPLCSYIVIE